MPNPSDREDPNSPMEDPKAAFEHAQDSTVPGEGDDSGESFEANDWTGEALRYLGDYELIERIAGGGMGVVYRARQRSLSREVAIKLIWTGGIETVALRERFKVEVEAVASLDHPGIVPIYEVGAHENHPYFSMKYLPGGQLSTYCAVTSDAADSASDKVGELGGERHRLKRAASIMSSVARAIHHAHRRGVLHRDLKPSNVLFDEFDRPVVTDFGLAKLRHRSSELTGTHALLGTPAFMAPEQASARSRDIGVPTDVYGLGATLYALLTGRPPHLGENPLEAARKAAETEPVDPRKRNPQVSEDLAVICNKAMRRDPALRYESAEELADDLDRWIEGRPIHARPVSSAKRLQMWALRHPAVASLVAVSSVLVLFILIGLPIAVVQIDAARKQELAQKRSAIDALNANRLREADNRFQAMEPTVGVSHLALAATTDPSNGAISEKLMYELTYRDWITPVHIPATEDNPILFSAFTPLRDTAIVFMANGQGRTVNLLSGTEETFVHGLLEGATWVTFSESGSRFAVLGNRRIEVFDYPPSVPRGVVDISVFGSVFFAFDPSERFLLVSGSRPEEPTVIKAYRCDQLEAAPTVFVSERQTRGQIHRETASEALLNFDGGFSVWNLENGSVRTRELDPGRSIYKVSSDGRWYFSKLEAAGSTVVGGPFWQQGLEGLRLWDADSLELAYAFDLEAGGFVPIGTLGAETGANRLFPGESLEELWRRAIPPVDGWSESRPLMGHTRGFVTSGEGRALVMTPDARGNSESRMIDLDTKAPLFGIGGFDNAFPHERTQNLYLTRISSPEAAGLYDSLFGTRLFPGYEYALIQAYHWSLCKRWFYSYALGTGIPQETVENANHPLVWRAIQNRARPDLPVNPLHLDDSVYIESKDLFVVVDHTGGVQAAKAGVFMEAVKSTAAGAGEVLDGATYRLELCGPEANFVGVGNGTAWQLWDLARQAPYGEPIECPGPFVALDASASHRRAVIRYRSEDVAAGSFDGYAASIVDIDSGAMLPIDSPEGFGHSLAVEGSCQRLLLQWGVSTVCLWDVIGNQAIGEPFELGVELDVDWPAGSGFAPDGSRAWVTTARDRFSVLNLERMEVERDLHLEQLFPELEIDGSSVGSDRSTSQRMGLPLTLHFLPDAQRLFVACGEYTTVLDLDDGEVCSGPLRVNGLEKVFLLPSGNAFWSVSRVASGDSVLELFSTATGDRLCAPITQAGTVIRIQTAELTHRALIETESAVRLIDYQHDVSLFQMEQSAQAFWPRTPNESYRWREVPFSPRSYLVANGEAAMTRYRKLSRPLELWRFPKLREATPEWLPGFVESLTRVRVASNGSVSIQDKDRYAPIPSRYRAKDVDSIWDRWLEWFTAPIDDRSISPFGITSVGEFDRRALLGNSLRGALDTARRNPSHEEARGRLEAVFSTMEPVSDGSVLEYAATGLIALDEFLGGFFGEGGATKEQRAAFAKWVRRVEGVEEAQQFIERMGLEWWEDNLEKWVEMGTPPPPPVDFWR